MRTDDVQNFLDECSRSSQHAYDSFRMLVAELEDPTTRVETRCFLTSLARVMDAHDAEEFLARYHFNLEKLAMAQSDDDEQVLQLLQLPSVFAPEEWSFTFFEGLTRYPPSEFYSKTVVEMGTGNGWISIALAKRSLPTSILGLDINPRAVTCAKINLYLNALDDHGNEVFDAEGKTLLQRVDFAVSDLLAYCREKSITPDRVIGCIPQVLDPDANVGQTIASEAASDQSLYALSNYCGQQGFIEDQFGLGLVAKAIEEAATICKPGYKLIFNLGGRPGRGVLMRMFERRGFQVQRIWETRVFQAPDTDISSLVEIEKNSLHRFEFFMGLSATESVSAKTAKAFQDAGGAIAHALGVFEAQTNHHGAIKKILGTLTHAEFKDVRSGLDLAFSDEVLGEEKISFLADLTERMNIEKWGYGETRGDVNVRRRIAEFLRSYFHIPLSAKNFLLTPNRHSYVRNFLWAYRPRIALVDKSFAGHLPKEWNAEGVAGINVIEAPATVDLLCKLIETLRPQCVVTKLVAHDMRTPDAFVRLVDVCEMHGALLSVDLSDEFELSSSPQSNGVFNVLSERALEPHVTLFCGLVKNRVYPDLEVCFVLSENETALQALESAAELTYSRVPIVNQFYYDRVFFRLLNFQLKSPRREQKTRLSLRMPVVPDDSFYKFFPALSMQATSAFLSPAIRGQMINLTPQSLRLDYGENELPVAGDVRRKILEAFLRQNISREEANPTDELAVLLNRRFGMERHHNDEWVYGSGVAPLFAGIAQQAAIEKTTMVFARGCYGYFVAAAQFFGLDVAFVTTHEDDQFKMTAKELAKVLGSFAHAVVYLNAPTVNPTGATYTQTEVDELLAVANDFRARMIIDATFSGLEFDASRTAVNLYESFKQRSSLELCLLGGVSKELASGGLRVGFGWTRSMWFARAMRATANEPHFTLLFWYKRILASINFQHSLLSDHLASQRQQLKQRAQQMSDVLTRCGWHVLVPQGGLFLVAKPSQSFFDQLDKHGNWNDNTVADLIFNKTNVLINSPLWTGLTGYCRLVLAVDERIFKDAMKQLEAVTIKPTSLKD